MARYSVKSALALGLDYAGWECISETANCALDLLYKAMPMKMWLNEPMTSSFKSDIIRYAIEFGDKPVLRRALNIQGVDDRPPDQELTALIHERSVAARQ